MRYIKLFESTESGYKEIEGSTYNDNIHRCLRFDTTETNILYKLAHTYNRCQSYDWNNETRFTVEKIIESKDNKCIYIRYNIYKCFDDWFYVAEEKGYIRAIDRLKSFNIIYYKCDNIEGLLNCIKNYLTK